MSAPKLASHTGSLFEGSRYPTLICQFYHHLCSTAPRHNLREWSFAGELKLFSRQVIGTLLSVWLPGP